MKSFKFEISHDLKTKVKPFRIIQWKFFWNRIIFVGAVRFRKETVVNGTHCKPELELGTLIISCFNLLMISYHFLKQNWSMQISFQSSIVHVLMRTFMEHCGQNIKSMVKVLMSEIQLLEDHHLELMIEDSKDFSPLLQHPE